MGKMYAYTTELEMTVYTFFITFGPYALEKERFV